MSSNDKPPVMVELPDDAIKALVEAASGIDIAPELLARIPEAVEYVNAWRKTLIDNGSLREESPTNEFLGVVTIAATWAVNGVIAARAEAVAAEQPAPWFRGTPESLGMLEAERAEVMAVEAAAVRAEAVAERDAIIEVIQQYLPEALPFNTLPEIVGGIARQRDFQHELKDHLAAVARRLTEERDAAVAEAVAAERQRIADGLVTKWRWCYDRQVVHLEAVESLLAGSVPVSTRLQPGRVGFGTDAFETGGSLPGQPVATQQEVVAWAVRAGDGSIYVPGDTAISAGTKEQAEKVVARCQGRGGEWSVVPLVVGSGD